MSEKINDSGENNALDFTPLKNVLFESSGDRDALFNAFIEVGFDELIIRELFEQSSTESLFHTAHLLTAEPRKRSPKPRPQSPTTELGAAALVKRINEVLGLN